MQNRDLNFNGFDHIYNIKMYDCHESMYRNSVFTDWKNSFDDYFKIKYFNFTQFLKTYQHL